LGLRRHPRKKVTVTKLKVRQIEKTRPFLGRLADGHEHELHRRLFVGVNLAITRELGIMLLTLSMALVV
jgi:hypothetical protein